MVEEATAEKPAASGPALSKEYEDLREELMRQITSIPQPSSTPNIVSQHFRVLTNTRIPELDNALATAYLAQDERDPGVKLYALVCNPKMPIRGNVIKATLGMSIPGMVTLHAAGLSDVAGINGRRMVLIYDLPPGKSLAAIMAERGNKPLTESLIAEQIVAPIGAVIQFFNEHDISHGRINPGNIFFGEKVVLGECASEPCGYSQPYNFEPPERAQALPAGKGESFPANDFFSLGMTAAFLRVGPRLFEKMQTPERYIRYLLQESVYNGLALNIEFSDFMTDLLRGTLNDNPRERWTWQQLKLWCKGRRYNMLPPSIPSLATRSLVIGSSEYYTMRTASHGLATHWDSAAPLINDGSLLRWLDLSLRRKDIGDILRRAVSSYTKATAGSSVANDDLTARAITILDPQAPLTIKEVRTHVPGVGPLMAEGFRGNVQPYIQHCMEIIETGLSIVWADMYKRKDEEPPGNVTNELWLLDRMRVITRIPGYGFGVERALYDLNPDLSCQSPLLGENHAATLNDLLQALNRLAPTLARNESPFDRHIASFISSKLSLGRESHLSEYANIPHLAKHKAFIMLRMFEQAQDSSGKQRVPALTAWVTAEVLRAVEMFHSATVREQLRSGLKQLADNGLFSPISSFVNQRVFASSDLDGFRESIQSYFAITQEIATLRNKREQKRKAGISGYAVAKYIAHIGLIIVAALVIRSMP